MSKKIFVLFVVGVMLCAVLDRRFTDRLHRRAASGFRDHFTGTTLSQRAALFWTVLRWPGPRLAPEGVYYLVNYFSVPTTTGPIGLTPGEEIYAVRETGSRVYAKIPTNAGPQEIEIPRNALTDDLDLAARLLDEDLSAQHILRAQIDADKAERDRLQLKYKSKPPTTLRRPNASASHRSQEVGSAIGSPSYTSGQLPTGATATAIVTATACPSITRFRPTLARSRE